MNTPLSTHSGPEHAKFLVRSGTHPLVLDLIMLRKFGSEYLGWEPATLWTEVQRTWGHLSTDAKVKIQAVRTAKLTYRPWRQWDVFEKVCNGFAGIAPTPEIQMCSPGNAAIAAEIMGHIYEDQKLSAEVLRYLAACFHHEGYAFAPPPLFNVSLYLRHWVASAEQGAAIRAFESGLRVFDKTSPAHVQAAKAMALKDYVAHHNQLLMQQMSDAFNTGAQ